MIANERKKEFAILRVLGSSRKMVAGIILKEALMVNFIGSVAGALTAIVAVLLVGEVSLTTFDLPFLLPGADKVALLALITIAASVAAGCLASSLSALKTSKIDTALILKEGN